MCIRDRIGRAGSGGMAGAWAQKPSRAQSCFPTKENPWGVGFGQRRPPAKQQGPGSRGSPAPSALWRAGGRGRKRLALLSRSEERWGCGLLPEESFPLQNAAARSSFGAVGATGPRSCAADLAQGAWLGPGRRRPSRAQYCFPAKENPWGVGFGGRRPPAKQQGPGSQGQPSPALPSGERRAGCENR